MVKSVRPLNDKQIKFATKSEKDYVLSDGNGLQMRIRSNGSKLWNFNYIHPVTKKRINMGLGTYPELSLANARLATINARELVANGIDPKSQRESDKLTEKATSEQTIKNVAQKWFDTKKSSITANYADDIWSSFEKHIFPKIANTPISQISAPLVISILRPLEARGNLETVKRLTQRLNEVMTFAVNCGMINASCTFPSEQELLSGNAAFLENPNNSN